MPDTVMTHTSRPWHLNEATRRILDQRDVVVAELSSALPWATFRTAGYLLAAVHQLRDAVAAFLAEHAEHYVSLAFDAYGHCPCRMCDQGRRAIADAEAWRIIDTSPPVEPAPIVKAPVPMDKPHALRIVRAVSELLGCCGNQSGQRLAVVHVLRKLDRTDPDMAVTPLEEVILHVCDRLGILEHAYAITDAWRTEFGHQFLAELETPTLCQCGEPLLNHYEAGIDERWIEGEGTEYCVIICTNEGVSCTDFTPHGPALNG
jgi:hypothetical protein